MNIKYLIMYVLIMPSLIAMQKEKVFDCVYKCTYSPNQESNTFAAIDGTHFLKIYNTHLAIECISQMPLKYIPKSVVYHFDGTNIATSNTVIDTWDLHTEKKINTFGVFNYQSIEY